MLWRFLSNCQLEAVFISLTVYEGGLDDILSQDENAQQWKSLSSEYTLAASRVTCRLACSVGGA